MRDGVIERYKMEAEEEWQKWVNEIPALEFSSEWQVKIIPPFGGAMVRFQVIKGDTSVSIYLDVYDNLGCFGSPYWELYPYADDTWRCPMNDTIDLLIAIEEVFAGEDKYDEEEEDDE